MLSHVFSTALAAYAAALVCAIIFVDRDRLTYGLTLGVAGVILLGLRSLHESHLRQQLKQAESDRRKLLAAMLLAEETERQRIATELHDDTIQVMTAVLLTLDVAAKANGAGPMHIRKAQELLRLALERTRHLMFEISPQVLVHKGIEPAVHEVLERAAEELHAGYELNLELEGRRFDPAFEALVYRTVREAIVNARRHSAATRLAVTLQYEGSGMRCLVEDNGRGFDFATMWRNATHDSAARHIGLPAMFERVRVAGGEMAVATAPNCGCRYAFWLPVEPTAEVPVSE